MNDRLVEATRDDLLLSTNRARIDRAAVLSMLLDSHWGAAMTAEKLDRAIENSICVGVYRGAEQLGFARVVTDLATYGYLTDVIVRDDARGMGIGSWMVLAIRDHPDLQDLRRLALWTRDARALYERHGFQPLGTWEHAKVSTYMELPRAR